MGLSHSRPAVPSYPSAPAVAREEPAAVWEDLYGKPAQGRALSWLEQLTEQHGPEAVATSMRAVDSGGHGFLSRVSDHLTTTAADIADRKRAADSRAAIEAMRDNGAAPIGEVIEALPPWEEVIKS